MNLKLIFGFLVVSVVFTGMADANIVVGDPVRKVYKEMGYPRLEFPLNGLFIQHYDSCIIKSRDGKIVEVLNTDGSTKAQEKSEVKAVEKNKIIAIEHVRIKAEAGDAESQYYMAYWCQTGQCIPQSMKEAIGWYTKAALQGHVASQHNLGVLYMNGSGVKKDLQQAYIWAILAAENGNDSLKKALSNSLNDEQKLASMIRVDQIKIRMLNIPVNKEMKDATSENGIVDSFSISN